MSADIHCGTQKPAPVAVLCRCTPARLGTWAFALVVRSVCAARGQLTACMPYLARLRDTVADRARIDMRDRPEWRTVGGCCGQDCGQRSAEASLRRACMTACLQRACRLGHTVADLALLDLRDRSDWWDVGGRCDQDWGQRSAVTWATVARSAHADTVATRVAQTGPGVVRVDDGRLMTKSLARVASSLGRRTGRIRLRPCGNQINLLWSAVWR